MLQLFTIRTDPKPVNNVFIFSFTSNDFIFTIVDLFETHIALSECSGLRRTECFKE